MPIRKKRTTKTAIKRMVYRKNRKRKVYRKKGIIRKALRGGGAKIPSNVANHLYVKLRYTSPVYYKTLDNVNNINGMVVIRGNNPYDPQGELGGGQPTYYDLYTAMYETFVCYGSKVKVEWFGQSTSNITSLQCAILPTIKQPYQIAGGSTNISNITEQRYVRYKRFRGGVSQPAKDCVVKSYMSSRKMWGRSKFQSTYDDVPTDNGTINSPWFWNIITSNDLLSASVPIAIKYTVTFYCKFKDLRPNIMDGQQSNMPDLPVPSMTGTANYSINFAGTGPSINTGDSLTGTFFSIPS